MATPSTTAVIVTYRSRSTIDRALETAGHCHDAGELNVVVVDNRGGDDTLEHVRANYPFAKAIDAGGNLGFGRGCNRGAEGATTPYLVFVNPDAALPLAALRTMVRFMDERPEVGICAPYIPGQWVGMMTRPADVLLESVGGKGYPDKRMPDPASPPFQTNWICGAIMMVRRSLFEQVGGFDPRFFLYFEETDLCRRCEETGSQIWLVPHAHALHDCGVSTAQTGETMYSGCIAEHYFQSRFYYLKKHHGLRAAALADLVELAVLGARTAKGALRGEGAIEPLKVRLQASVLRSPPRR